MNRGKDKIEYAIYYATKAHKNQRRKIEDVDMIFHPYIVGMILQRNGCDEDIVAAGILHDVVEDTPHEFEDIEREFGKQVRDYVYDASEPDKSLEWEDRKKHTIEQIKNASLGSKLIVACDKISNLEDLSDCIELYGEEKSWSSLKREKDIQKWYYTSVYESCVNRVDGNHPIFKRYKKVLEHLFNY
ncbi:MAG: bifunctional (p)ppGpp synthetase/guanosine-3',5'-bis(diphosphate) 3'-pyrophosphohydrolase [Clostridia bacterium]|nr:bifunctional (p)ppGpp synthetase/guanosine-3',5'-bis(diphosphate) 3'-pyrophosphohydrolase [Clostridia bacterium]